MEDIAKCFSEALKILTEPTVPGTVTAYQAMENLSKNKDQEDRQQEYQRAKGAVETHAQKCARIAAERIEKTLKGRKSGGDGAAINAFCRETEVKECACYGVEPDRPNTVSNCGNYYQASVTISAGNPETNVKKMLEYAKALEKACGRKAFIKHYESKGLDAAIHFDVAFRIGKPQKTTKPSRSANKKAVK